MKVKNIFYKDEHFSFSLTLQNSLQSKNGEKESDVSSFIQPVKYNGKLTTTPKYKFYYPIRKKITTDSTTQAAELDGRTIQIFHTTLCFLSVSCLIR